jgi:nucleoid-associated protein YgaU
MAKAQPEEQISESYISIGLGILVVVVVGILLYNYFTQRGTKTEEPQETPETLTDEATKSAIPGKSYTVAQGDTLWSISEKAYGTGYNWEDIAKANNLTNADILEKGQNLVLPQVSPKLLALASSSPNPTPVVVATPIPLASPVLPATGQSPLPVVSITGTSYTVIVGDTLWDIACRAYGDCYAWVKVAEANKLKNPDLIHPGNVFTLPR